jgi:hypothetical protein
MKVIILCGGKGLRMQGILEDIPKPLVRVQGNARGEAFLELELMVWECPLKFLASEALFRHTKL